MRDTEALDAGALARLEARMERLEGAIGRLTELLDQAPAQVGMALDIADEFVARQAARGVDVDGRLRAAAGLLERLTEPRTAAALERSLRRAEALEPALEQAAAVPDHIGVAVDIADEFVARQAARGVDVDERLRAAAGLLERLTDPETVAALERSLEHVHLLEQGTAQAAALPGYVGLAFDLLDEEAARLQGRGVDIDQATRNGLELLARLGRLAASPGMVRAMDSGALEPRFLSQIASILGAVRDTFDEEPTPMGAFAIFSALKDPQVQRFVGFSFALARRLGASLHGEGSLPATTR